MVYFIVLISFIKVIQFTAVFSCSCNDLSPDKWLPWSTWTACNLLNQCSAGVRTRSREFNNIFCGECSSCSAYPHTCQTETCALPNNGCEHFCDVRNSGMCSCKVGYTLNADKKACNDINECIQNNGECTQDCLNYLGGYDCRCKDGYFLEEDGKSCRPYNCSNISISDCPTDSYSDHFGSVCNKVSLSCTKEFQIDSQCHFNCPDKFALAIVQRVSSQRFAEDLASSDFKNVIPSITCTYKDGEKWTTPGIEVSKYFCRRLADPPNRVTVSNLEITEHAPVDTQIGKISSVHSSAVKYSILNGLEDFKLDGQTLKNYKVFNLKNLKDYVKRITIRAEDVDNPALYVDTSFNITIINVNDPPQNIILSNNSYTDLSPVGFVIGELSAIDYDSIDPQQTSDFLWELIPSALTDQLFTLDKNKLQLKQKSTDTKDVIYALTVKCTDKDATNPKSATKEFFVFHKNLNEHPINFVLDIPTLYENATVGSKVGSLTATDFDNDTMVFDNLSGEETFKINPVKCFYKGGKSIQCTTDIILAKALDYEVTDKYQLIIKATDIKGEFNIERFDVYIHDVNERPFDILLSDYEFDENFDGKDIEHAKKIQVLDHDRTQKHNCTVIGANTPFKVVGDYLVLARTLNYEVQSVYDVLIECNDNGVPSLSFAKAIKIFVKDHNDPPSSISFQLTVDRVTEDMQNVIIAKLVLQDEDFKYDHVCEVVKNQGKVFVGVVKENGENYIKVLGEPLDYESQQNLVFSVSCIDIGDKNYTLVKSDIMINIYDVNEVPLSPCPEVTFVSFQTLLGTPVMTLTSRDPDNELYLQGLEKAPKQVLTYILLPESDYVKMNTDHVLVLKKQLIENNEIKLKVMVIDDGRLVVHREENNDFQFYNGTPKSQLYTCTLFAVAPTDPRIPFVFNLSSTDIVENFKKEDHVGYFSMNKLPVTSYEFSIYRQSVNILNEMKSGDLLKIEENILLIRNDTSLHHETIQTYDVIVKAENLNKTQIVYKLFKLTVLAACGPLFNLASNNCVCKNGYEGMKCDRNPLRCLNTTCSADETCSMFISSPKRCIPAENQLPILLRSVNYTHFISGVQQYIAETTVKTLLEVSTLAGSRTRKSVGDNIYVEASDPREVLTATASYTYVKFIPMNINSNLQLMQAKALCPRLVDTNARCINKEDCEILKSAGIKCPDLFGDVITPTSAFNVDNKIAGTSKWVWGVVSAVVLVCAITILVVVYFRRYRTPLKEGDPAEFQSGMNNLRMASGYLHVPNGNSPMKNNLNMKPNDQTLRDINALRMQTDILVFENKIFSTKFPTDGTREVMDAAYSVRGACSRSYNDDPNQEAVYETLEHHYESVGRSSKNPLYVEADSKFDGTDKKKSVENEYIKTDAIGALLETKKERWNDRIKENQHAKVELANDSSKKVVDLSETEFKPILRGPSINQFRPEDDEKDKTFVKNNLKDGSTDC